MPKRRASSWEENELIGGLVGLIFRTEMDLIQSLR